MTGAEFVVATQALSLTTERAAKWLGVHRSVAYRYANGSSPIPGPVARALRLALGLAELKPVDFDDGGNEYERQYGLWYRRADLAPLLAMEG